MGPLEKAAQPCWLMHWLQTQAVFKPAAAFCGASQGWQGLARHWQYGTESSAPPLPESGCLKGGAWSTAGLGEGRVAERLRKPSPQGASSLGQECPHRQISPANESVSSLGWCQLA